MPRQIQDQNIVIVEDDLYISQTLNDFFSGRNTVQTFASAEEARKAESLFDHVTIFILDYKLPEEDGISLFQHFKGNFPKGVYILITGEMSYEMAESTRTLGLDALMLKPFDFMILEDNIAGLLAAA